MSSNNTKILSGKLLASLYRKKIQAVIEKLKNEGKRAPGLAVVLVGDNPASAVYVKNKEKAALSCGFYTENYHLAESTSSNKLSALINDLNQNPQIDGILLQLPLPAHLNADFFVEQIDPEKDSDGLHPYNQGKLFRGQEAVYPCTPLGILRLIDLAFSEVNLKEECQISVLDEIKKQDLSGLNALVIGRSALVGKPVSVLLLQRNATVTIAHSRTKNLKELSQKSDILVAAAGVKELVNKEYVSQGQIVIDVGINR
ncbi:MAG: bifunctional 5,10-methylenetetrahydrofolate dehydrogenase/5,10-methenyltetrahydrofolate cyclohydrolase, partial [Candidatus Dadabacteria bacterium]